MSTFPNALAFESLTPTEIAKAATIFDNLKHLRIKLKNGDENILEKAFEIHVQSLLEKLEARLMNLGQNPQFQKMEIILAKHGLYDAAFQQVILLCQSISPILGDGIKELRNAHSSFLSDFQTLCHSYAEESQRYQEELNNHQIMVATLQENIRKCEETIKLLDDESEVQNKKIIELRNQLRSATQEINYLRETPINMHDSYPNSTKKGGGEVFGEVPSSKQGMKRSNSSNSLNITGNSNPNINPNASNTSAGQYGGSGNSGRKRSSSAGRFRQSDNNFDMTGGSVNMSVTEPTMMTRSSIHSNPNASTASPVRGTMALLSPVQWLHSFREDVQRAMDVDGRCRLITINECKDLIRQCYESKNIANEKALQGGGGGGGSMSIIPMETMEQHTFRILEKKYGLRSLAVGHAGMLLKALDVYSIEDNEISVFQKIFRNEIEEDFRYVQEELMKSIKELTMVQLMSRNPLKDQQHLNNLLETKINTGVIYEDEWKDMINYLYNSSDATTLGVLLKRQALLERDDSPAITATSSNQQFHSPDGSNANGPVTPSSGTHFLPGNTLISHKISKSNATYVVGSPNMVYHSSDALHAGQLGYDKCKVQDIKRLGYSSPSLKISIKDPNQQKISRKDYLKLPFTIFIKIVLDFQLRSHIEYLANFTHLFKQFDKDVDGVLNGAEFKEFFHILYQNTPRQQGSVDGSGSQMHPQEEEEEELKALLTLVKLIDPHEHDRFVFSSAVICLQKLQ